jgi:hypothetical protein
MAEPNEELDSQDLALVEKLRDAARILREHREPGNAASVERFKKTLADYKAEHPADDANAPGPPQP